jgi:hypothetical protein
VVLACEEVLLLLLLLLLRWTLLMFTLVSTDREGRGVLFPPEESGFFAGIVFGGILGGAEFKLKAF